MMFRWDTVCDGECWRSASDVFEVGKSENGRGRRRSHQVKSQEEQEELMARRRLGLLMMLLGGGPWRCAA